MKKNYYLLLLLAFLSTNLINAQDCPETIGNQSSINDIVFKIPSGTCGEYASFNFIDINTTTFQHDGCSGTNLKYTYLSGPALSSSDTFTVFFGLGFPAGFCNYVGGVLTSLSTNNVKLNESVSIYPNPLIKQRELNLKFATNLSAKVYMYDVTGKLAIRDEVSNAVSKKINTSALTNGIYFLQISTDEASITRKVIVMN